MAGEGRSVFTTTQPAYNAGELSPLLFGRIDLEKYKSGLALARNVFIDYHGGLSNRPGTQYIATVPATTGTPKGIPFIVNTETSYSVVFTGDGNIQFFSNGVYVAGADLVSPYAEADVPLVKWNQSADVMTLTHPSYPIYNLTRTGPSTFTLATPMQGPLMQPPTSPAGYPQDSTNTDLIWIYAITSVSTDGREESLPCTPFVFAGQGGTTENTINNLVWSQPASGPVVGYYNIYKAGPFASRGVSDVLPGVVPSVYGYVGQSSSTSFFDNNFTPDFSRTPPVFEDPWSPGQIASVQPTATTGWTGYSAAFLAPLVFTGGSPTVAASGYAIINTATNQPVGCIIVTPGIGYQTAPTVTDSVGNATYTATLGQATGTYPGTSTYFQQRLTYGGTNNFPESFVASKPGVPNNFDTSIIAQADDSITASISSVQNNTIKSMVPMSLGLIVFTYGSAFLVSGGGQGTAVTPSSIVALPQASFGASDLPPIPINYTVMYTEALGFTVRDLTFNFYNQAYVGVDRSILSSHLFFNYSFLDWGFAQAPFRLLHMTRNDGQLLVLTYAPEQEMFAWTHYDTNGQFVSCWSVPEGQTNAVYVIVKRFIQGTKTWTYFLERFVFRNFTYPIDLGMWFVDAGLSLPQNAPTNTLQLGTLLNGQGTFQYSGSLVAANAGDIIQAYGCQFQVLASAAGSIEVQLLFGSPPTVPNDPFNTVIPFTSGNWTITTPVQTVDGLDYLDGMYVTGMADGVVVPPTIVVNGAIKLPAPATSILLGLGYTSQVQTLRLTAQGSAEDGKRKNIPAVTLRQYQSAGVQVGKDFAHLVTQKSIFFPLNPQVQLIEGDVRSVIGAQWTKDGQICFQQSLPLPMTILADFPEVVPGDTYRG